MSARRRMRRKASSSASQVEPTKSASNSLDWDSPSAKTGTVKRRPVSGDPFHEEREKNDYRDKTEAFEEDPRRSGRKMNVGIIPGPTRAAISGTNASRSRDLIDQCRFMIRRPTLGVLRAKWVSRLRPGVWQVMYWGSRSFIKQISWVRVTGGMHQRRFRYFGVGNIRIIRRFIWGNISCEIHACL